MESQVALTRLFSDGSLSGLQVEFVMWQRLEIRRVHGILVASGGPVSQQRTGDGNGISTQMGERAPRCPGEE